MLQLDRTYTGLQTLGSETVSLYKRPHQAERSESRLGFTACYCSNIYFIYLFIYLGFHVAFNTVQVISRRVVGRAEETSTIQFIRVLYCKLPTNGKQLPAFPLEAVQGTEPRPQRWEGRVLPLCHRGPLYCSNKYQL